MLSTLQLLLCLMQEINHCNKLYASATLPEVERGLEGDLRTSLLSNLWDLSFFHSFSCLLS
jgi:hypothetical protein